MKTRYVLITFALGLGVTLALLLILGGRGTPAVLALSADPPTCDYATVQAAVDDANDGDVIKVATGAYTDIHQRAGITQVVYISKTVTVRGGYTTTNWTTPDPLANPTTLDAQGQGRVLYITGDISPTVEGLCITGGDAAGLGGHPWGDSGGGVYVNNAMGTISGNQVFSNTADNGGGLLLDSSDATLSGNTISANTAFNGGGLYLSNSDNATLSGNTVISNTASNMGGGLYLDSSAAVLTDNTATANTAGQGGGLLLYNSDATLSRNSVISNSATNQGGGLWIRGDAMLSGNTIISNTASYGGGLVLDLSDATLSGNTVSGNTATGQYGGGLAMSGSDAMLSGNTFSSNSSARYGGGLFLWSGNPTLTNNVIADNHANIAGSGLYIFGSSPQLLHTTIARNTGGNGSGVHVTDWVGTYSTAALTNTILVSHTVGVYVATGNAVRLEGTLWGSESWANTTDWDGSGTVITGTVNLWGDPSFLNPDYRDYHIGSDSAAIDVGVDAGVTVDIDGEPRPAGTGYDIGADEYYHPALDVTKQADPNPVQAGALLTYTIRVTNTGNTTLHATVTDTLPTHVTPGGILTWTPTITAPDGVWTQTVVVTVERGYCRPLINVVEVTTAEGATGIYTKTSAVVEYCIYLPMILKNSD
jgi:uncharacterized repeat protein (TIGR01451 family)